MKHRVLDPAALKVETFETEAAKRMMLFADTIIVRPDTGPDDTWQCGCCRNPVQ